MTKTRIRARLLTFDRAPVGPEDEDAWHYIEDGALLIEDGRIISIDNNDIVDDLDVDTHIDHRPHLLLPGFVDPHIHFPQQEVLGAYAAGLLDWLNDHTFPAEAAFSDNAHAAAMATAFFDALLRNGTTSVAAFGSVHPGSADAFFREAQTRGMGVVGGKVMMDRNAPASVLDTAQRSYDETKAGIARWHGVGRGRYAISPRFALTSTEAQLEAAGSLMRDHPDCLMQTHMDENRDEIETAAKLFPQATDYLDIYEQYGLINNRALLGHCIHLTPRERARMGETGAVAVHCPTSNLFLGSGLFNPEGLRWGVATDIGGGTSFSMLATLDAAYKIQQLRGSRLDPYTAFDRITRGNAEVLGMTDIGSLAPGMMADLVVLDAKATPEMALRHGRISALAEELFLLQTCGDDRAVVETYVAGKPMKPRPERRGDVM